MIMKEAKVSRMVENCILFFKDGLFQNLKFKLSGKMVIFEFRTAIKTTIKAKKVKMKENKESG